MGCEIYNSDMFLSLKNQVVVDSYKRLKLKVQKTSRMLIKKIKPSNSSDLGSNLNQLPYRMNNSFYQFHFLNF